ncbi:MAG TPA: hypothetical protein VK595_07745, partial [Vicinamibacterales bacterium]|nr:hypothetical protein [Vicinamibacterales bacterium]
MSKPRRSALAGVLMVLLAAGTARAQVGVTDGPKGVVVNSRTGKAYAVFPDLGVVKILDRAGRVTTVKNMPATFVAPINEWYSWNPSPRLNPDIKVLMTL